MANPHSHIAKFLTWNETVPAAVETPLARDSRLERPVKKQSGTFPYLAGLTILTALYFVGGKCGLRLASIDPSATAVWPPTGIALAALLLFGTRLWPAVFLGAFLVNLTTAGTVATSIEIALGNTLEAIVGAYLVNRFANGRNAFDRAQDIFKFALFAAVFSTAISAIVGVTSRCLAGLADWHHYRAIWLTWWLGDMGGALILAPSLILWIDNHRVRWQRAQKIEAALMLLCLVLVGAAVFGGLVPMAFLSFPVLLWCSFRFGCREAATAVLLLSAFAIWGTLSGLGPFTAPTQNESFLLLGIFTGVIAVTAMTLAAVVSQQRQAELALRRNQEELEQRIQQRTAELASVVEALQNEAKERERARGELDSSEAHFRAVADTALDGIVSANAQGKIIYLNKTAERMYGYSPAEAIGQPLFLLMPERFRDLHQRRLARFLATGEARALGKTSELAGRRKDGSEFPLELSLASWKIGDSLYFTGIMCDITERKRAEAALRESEERFRLLVNGVADYAIFMLDPQGRVESWNAGAERIKGYKAEEIIGRHFSCFYTEEDIQDGVPERLLKTAIGHGRVEEEGWRLRKDGSRFWADVVLAAVRDEAGKFRGFVKVTRDITERREALEAVRRLNRELEYKAAQLEVANKELESFSYSVSHDLRAPLRSLDGFSKAVLEEYSEKLDTTGRDHLGRIRAASQRMSQLIDDLLRLARVSRAELHLQRVELSAIARTVADGLQQTQPDRAVHFLITDGLVAHGDARLLTVALENLLGNAWKFTAKHAQATIELGVTQRDGKPVFFVRDDGAGFDMNHAGKLFGAFQRLHSPHEFTGTGVGLATVQRIVRRHGGEIWAQGAVEQGATFYFTL